jgi:hypothetical protein
VGSATPVSRVDVGNYPASALIPAAVLDVYRSTLVVPATYIQAPWPNTNFSAYSENKNPTSGGSTVNYFGNAVQTSAAGGAWTLNGILTNIPIGASLGGDFGSLYGVEINHNIKKKTAGVTPAGTAEGIRLVGSSEVVPSGGAYGFRVRALGYTVSPKVPWTVGFMTDDAGASTGLKLGAQAEAGASVVSQTITLAAYDSGSALKTATIQQDGAATFRFIAAAGGGANLTVGGSDILTTSASKVAMAVKSVVGSLTQATDANGIGLFHAATDENLEIRGHTSLASGVAIQSINDALNASKNLELIADTLRFTVNAINVNGTAGVSFTGSPTASFQVINGIVVHQ